MAATRAELNLNAGTAKMYYHEVHVLTAKVRWRGAWHITHCPDPGLAALALKVRRLEGNPVHPSLLRLVQRQLGWRRVP